MAERLRRNVERELGESRNASTSRTRRGAQAQNATGELANKLTIMEQQIEEITVNHDSARMALAESQAEVSSLRMAMGSLKDQVTDLGQVCAFVLEYNFTLCGDNICHV